MTRKDYIKIADVFKYAYDEAEDIRERNILDIMLAEMMHTLKADNSRFDKTRFVDYINFNR
jgi:isopentenyldiphosphate isomerase